MERGCPAREKNKQSAQPFKTGRLNQLSVAIFN